MCGPRRLPTLYLLLLLVPLLTAQNLPDEPREGGDVLLPGRLPWGTTVLPTGEVLAPCEDQTLSVLDGQARIVASWKAPARFSGPATAGPSSSFQLVAVPLVSGRVEVLVWDSQTRSLSSVFAFERDSVAVALAWGQAGTLVAAWKDGTVEAWSSQGTRLWATRVEVEATHLLFDDNRGVSVLGVDHAVLLDRGQQRASVPLGGRPRGVLQTVGGDLYTWTEQGLWKRNLGEEAFRLFDAAPGILGVLVDHQDRLILTESQRLRRLTRDGALLSTVSLPSAAVTASTLDDRGRILVGTNAGLQVWTYDGRFLATLDEQTPASAFHFGAQGTGAWSSVDWRVHVWSGWRWPVFGWPQEGGTPGRTFSARSPASVAVRAAAWTEDAEFNHLFQMVASGEESKQREVLERLEARAREGKLLATWPFANLLLLKIARSGVTDLIMRDRHQVTNNWPALRLRAFQLLGSTATPEDREELLGLLSKEYDPLVAAQGTRALVQSAWDGDGRLLRLLAELRARLPDQNVVADAVIDAARQLWLVNGRSADPVLIPLVSAIYQGPYPRSVKAKAQRFFQDLLESPN